jgi:hypothetical protein
VLNVGITDISLNRFRWFALIEHQIVESDDGGFVLFEAV